MFGWKKFFIATLGTLATLSLTSIATNILVDPYDIWRDDREIGFNFCAIRSENIERLMKPIRVLEFEPETILLGNSKIDFALNPDRFDRCYNLALRNAQPHEILKIIETTRARKILLAIDFDMFVDAREFMPGFDESQLESNRMTLRNFFTSTLSKDSILDSITTVRENRREQFDYRTIDRDGKYDDRFLARLFESENDFFATSRQLIIETKKLESLEMFRQKLRDFEKIVEICRKREIELTILIPPVHSTHIEAYEFHRTLYESWLKKIIEIHPVIDFVALEGEFWNSSHMKTSLGDQVISRIQAGDFELTTSENVETHLENLWKNLKPSDSMKFVGRFSQDRPKELEGKIPETSDQFKIDWIEPHGDILSIRGQLDLPRDEVIVSFVKIGESYSRLTNLNLDATQNSVYSFYTEAILPSDIKSSAQIFCVTKSHGIIASKNFVWE